MTTLCTQIRVMPRCAYVLLRFFLRVDKVRAHTHVLMDDKHMQVLLRLRETRVCVEFAEGQRGTVVRECKVTEGTFEELRAAGAPSAEVCRGGGRACTRQRNRQRPTWMLTARRWRCKQWPRWGVGYSQQNSYGDGFDAFGTWSVHSYLLTSQTHPARRSTRPKSWNTCMCRASRCIGARWW